jgi:hypothetical protein
MGLKGYRLWVMGQLGFDVQSPTAVCSATWSATADWARRRSTSGSRAIARCGWLAASMAWIAASAYASVTALTGGFGRTDVARSRRNSDTPAVAAQVAFGRHLWK